MMTWEYLGRSPLLQACHSLRKYSMRISLKMADFESEFYLEKRGLDEKWSFQSKFAVQGSAGSILHSR